MAAFRACCTLARTSTLLSRGALRVASARPLSVPADEARRAALRKFGIDPDEHAAREQASKEQPDSAAAPADTAPAPSDNAVDPNVEAAWKDYAEYMTHQRDRGWKD